MRSLVTIKPSRNGENTLSFTDEGKSCHSRDFNSANMFINAIRKNKILAKISEFTVPKAMIDRTGIFSFNFW